MISLFISDIFSTIPPSLSSVTMTLAIGSNIQAIDPDIGTFWPAKLFKVVGNVATVRWDSPGKPVDSCRMAEKCEITYGQKSYRVLRDRGGTGLFLELRQLQKEDWFIHVTGVHKETREPCQVIVNDPFRCEVSDDAHFKFIRFLCLFIVILSANSVEFSATSGSLHTFKKGLKTSLFPHECHLFYLLFIHYL